MGTSLNVAPFGVCFCAQNVLYILSVFRNRSVVRYACTQAADGKTGTKRSLNPEEEAKKKKRMERFGIVDEEAEAAKRREVEVRISAV